MTKPADLTSRAFDEVAAGELTFDEIAGKYGEQVAINVGIARDPDNPEVTAAMFAQAQPAIEVHPHLVAQNLRRRQQRDGLAKWAVSIELDVDVLAYFLEGGPGWEERLNAALRRAVPASAQGGALGGE